MTFEDLESWRQARQLTRQVYVVTHKGELSRDFGLCSQIQRAAVSTMSNVAEGFERQHIPESFSSTMSLLGQTPKSAPSRM